MKLRLHHLLCIRAYKGNGYSKSFIEHMNGIIESVNNIEEVDIADCLDDICKCCPNKVNEKCVSEEKVNRIDLGVVKLLGINIGNNQNYRTLENRILNRLTRDVFNKICFECEWKQSGICNYEDVKRRIG